ncbi:MAG: glycosyltransferase, partial [Steroidobacteraceae bacterium]
MRLPPLSIELLVSLVWLGLVAWLILRAFGQRHALERVRLTGPQGTPPARVTVIVPARDEAANIGPCLRSLLAQHYPEQRLRIIVVDDDSSDDTARIASGIAAGDTRVEVLATPPLPPHWKGKPHALEVGARATPAADAEWLCFMDADMRAHPALVASAVAAAEAERLDLLSLAPRHRLESFAERLILPCGLYLLGFSQDLERIQAPASGDAVATGQFMLLRREAYEQAGGFAAVRAEICEDVALARLLKRRGRRVLLEDGSELLETRMYTGWGTLWPGIAKNLVHMLGGPGRTLVAALVAVTLAWAAVLVP